MWLYHWATGEAWVTATQKVAWCGSAFLFKHWCLSDTTAWLSIYFKFGLSWWLSGKESTCQCWRCRFDPWVSKIPWRRKWQPIPVFLPGKYRGQRSLAGYSPWGLKESRHDLATKQEQQLKVCKNVFWTWPSIWKVLSILFYFFH